MAGQNPGSPTDFQYFYEDEVYKINNRGQVVYGLVLENYEANSSDQESDIETPIQKGEIRVVWHPSGTERVISEKSVGLADRSLMPGDVVRRLIAGKDTQRGYCRDIVMKAALQIVGTKHVIPTVVSERLQPLEEFTPDLAVCLDSWVGTSKVVHSKLRLVSSDGSRLEYPDLDSCPLEDYSMRRRRSTPYQSSEFYPGQVVYGPLGSLENANWLNVTKEMKAARKHKMHDHKFTVESVITESVSVHWQCRAMSTAPSEGNSSQQPKFLVEGDELKNLKLLNVFEPCTLQVGDRNFLVIGSEDTFTSKKQWRKDQSKIYRSLRKETRPSKKSSRTETNLERVPSRPKKRASSHRKWKITERDTMDVDGSDDKIESLDDVLAEVANCPAIKIEPMGDGSGQGSQEDTATEEKNDSGISPEPTREESLLNGDIKSELPNDDDSDNWENTSSDGSDTDSGATWSSRCSSVASTRGKRSPQLAVRLLRGKRLKRAVRRAPPAPPPRLGERVVVETLHTQSVANVVWQDGTIELGIPSTQLYPIHHLDGQECFPGDFVVSGAANVEENVQLKHREYGVVQKVDHHGRTAIVHWFRTYTSVEEPVPQMLNESEMSVYDLKDHPDFQYRPGTVVIRVANFTGEDSHCTAGQVIDNFPTGRVKVWWVDGHTSMCWPQDLYKVGEYDSDEGELWASDASGSEDSWETQSSAHEPEPRTPDAVFPPTTPATDATIDAREVAGVIASMKGNSVPGWDRIPANLIKACAAYLAEPLAYLCNLYNGTIVITWDGLGSPAFEDGPHSLDAVAVCTNSDAPASDASIGFKVTTYNAFPEIRTDVLVMPISTPDGPPPVPRLLEPRVAAHIERGRLAMSRLEEIFAKHPVLQSQEIMRKLLNLYKDCRFLDKLMGTTYFHEDHFLGLLERVRERGASTPCAGERRVHEQLARLFTPDEPPAELLASDERTDPTNVIEEPMEMDEKLTSQFIIKIDKSRSDGSGTSAPANGAVLDVGITNSEGETITYPATIEAIEVDANSSNVCYKLCGLIHTQLVKAHAEISRRRPLELAVFLNKVMQVRHTFEGNMPYQFSVQYGQLVVSMATEADREKEEDERKQKENQQKIVNELKTTADGAEAMPTLDPITADVTMEPAKETVPETPATTETAPLALAEKVEMDGDPPASHGSGMEGFSLLESAPAGHRFRLSMLQPSEPRTFYSAVKREIKLLKSDLPSGVWVRGFEDRLDLLSVMIAGPTKTPYEGGLFIFDVQLGGEYPRAPPLCHYHSYCSDRLNPNLYEDGKVCVSLLGTWSGRGVEVWRKDSSLLQVIVSLQGLILNDEPYFNEAGYEKQKGTQQGRENSRMYNEMVLLKLVQSMTKMLMNPPEPFREEILHHLKTNAANLCQRLEGLVQLSNGKGQGITPPEYPLIPASRGFCLTLSSSLESFRNALRRNDIIVPPSTL